MKIIMTLLALSFVGLTASAGSKGGPKYIACSPLNGDYENYYCVDGYRDNNMRFYKTGRDLGDLISEGKCFQPTDDTDWVFCKKGYNKNMYKPKQRVGKTKPAPKVGSDEFWDQFSQN